VETAAAEAAVRQVLVGARRPELALIADLEMHRSGPTDVRMTG